MNNSATSAYWKLRLEKAADALRGRGFGVSVLETAQEAAKHLVTEMLGAKWQGVVNFGGSLSVDQSGVVSLLEEMPGAEVVQTHSAFPRDDKFFALRREFFFCDLYLCSSNALTMDGRLLNVDGLGNRVASLLYGPRQVVLFVGRNKLCQSLEEADTRIRTLAAPMNCMRLGLNNPCVKTGRCMDCKTQTRICNFRVVTEFSRPAGRIHVLLVNEDLGF